ncbi:MAG TPA: phospholipid carrier-dependent glycosyltransferase [Mycobacteriales bacterium]|nr:phospholipid carrier-dependent glycosyltransferase [Mycobacteriales bacterium]
MTATLERPAAPPTSTWRDRLQPATAGLSPAAGWVAALAVGAVAAVLRLVRLDLPAGRVFDEVYYSCDAQNLLRFGVEVDTASDPDDDSVAKRCEPTGEPGFVVHPPLGKWAIALGIRLLGADELGWRLAAAVAGAVTVVVLVRMVRRMTGSTPLGCLAGLLLALDGLHFVQSRIAMLDVFLVLWTTAAAACLVADRDWVRSRLATADDDALAGWGPRLLWRPWLLACGGCLGAAVATKWSGLYFLPVLGLLALGWEAGARRAAGIGSPLQATVFRSLVPLATALLVLPAVVYTASWVGWFTGELGWDRRWAQDNPGVGLAALVPDGLRSLWHYHVEIFRFHDGLTSSHPYQSRPASWLVLGRPVSYYYPQDVGQGDYGCEVAQCSREVLAIGTPAIWWAALLAVPALLGRWVALRDWRAGAAVALVATALLPWVREDLDGRTMFLFYALPAVPFLCLCLALAAGWAVGGPTAGLSRRRWVTMGVGLYLAVVVANFAYLYPVLAAQTIPFGEWQDRMWFPSWI